MNGIGSRVRPIFNANKKKDALMRLMELYTEKILGAIKGLDRIRFRGTLRGISNTEGINMFMNAAGILLKDFKHFVEERTHSLRKSCEQNADCLGIPKIYLRSGAVDKEDLARSIAAENQIENGPICLFSVVEPCTAPLVCGNRESKKLELQMVPRKCIFLYQYFDHPEIGFGHIRVQSWLPFQVTVCLNGRHWLEKQLQKRNCRFVKDGNCFPWIEDMQLAQKIMDAQLKTNWNGLLSLLLNNISPEHEKILAPVWPNYYWSADETEYATDIMFHSAAELNQLYPSFIRHAMLTSDSPAIMRFFGNKNPRGVASKEIITDFRRRYEGVRIKHWKNRNSIKMYNKAGSILRVETTINCTRDFKVFRHPNDDQEKPASWQKMRKGTADLYRRCEISDQCNTRYADAIATANTKEKLLDAVNSCSKKVRWKGQRFRALNVWHQDDFNLLRFLAHGEHAINGFRNKELTSWLFHGQQTDDKAENRRRAGIATRRIRLLRSHGLIRKAPRVNRYIVTPKAQKLAAGIMSASRVHIEKLMEMAA